MKLRRVFVTLAAGCLVIALCLISRWAGMGSPGVFSRETQAAPREDFQKGRALLQAGDAKRLKKDFEGAQKCYEEAANVFQAAGIRLFVAPARQMAEMCAGMPLDMSRLKNGTYEGAERGYIGDITVEIDVKNGKISRFQVVSHKENKPLKSLDVVPQEILNRQSPSVDAVTGATVTSCAVMSATFKALEKAK